MVFLSVDYDEFRPETYRAVVVVGGKTEVRFGSGDPPRDWKAALAYLNGEGALCSSSVDTFVSDGGRLEAP